MRTALWNNSNEMTSNWKNKMIPVSGCHVQPSYLNFHFRKLAYSILFKKQKFLFKFRKLFGTAWMPAPMWVTSGRSSIRSDGWDLFTFPFRTTQRPKPEPAPHGPHSTLPPLRSVPHFATLTSGPARPDPGCQSRPQLLVSLPSHQRPPDYHRHVGRPVSQPHVSSTVSWKRFAFLEASHAQLVAMAPR